MGDTGLLTLDCVATSASSFLLSWDYRGSTALGFIIYRSGPGDAAWQEIARLPATARQFTSTGMLPRQAFHHAIAAIGPDDIDERVASAETTSRERPEAWRGTIIAPRTKAYPRAGEGSIARSGTRLLYIYGRYRGSGDYAWASLMQRSSDNDGANWSDETPILESSHQLALPSLLELPCGTLLLSYLEIVDQRNARRLIRRSTDNGRNWGAAQAITDGVRPYMTGSHDRLRRLSNGRLIHPVHAFLDDEELATFVYVSDDSGRNWHRTTDYPLRVPARGAAGSFQHGFWEAAIAETAPGVLLMAARTATGRLYRSRSADFGSRWSQPEAMPVLAPTAPPNLVQLDVGTTMLIWSPHVDAGGAAGGPRLVLGSLLSRDGGESWGDYREIEHSACDWLSYPSIFADQACLHLTYYGENDGAGDARGNGNIFGGSRYLRLPIG